MTNDELSKIIEFNEEEKNVEGEYFLKGYRKSVNKDKKLKKMREIRKK